MKKILISLTLLMAMLTPSYASHLLGGEITWECLKSGPNQGKFIFTMKLYRACYSGAATLPTSANIANPLFATYGGPSQITVTRTTQLDLSPACYDPTKQIRCGVSLAAGGGSAMEEDVYVSSTPIQLNGIPAAGGSDFWWSSCCRPAVVNLTGSNYWLRATMYPYTDPSTSTVLSVGSGSTPTCYDSSPKFAERPATIICTGYKFTYNHNAVDDELDSLHYEWTLPMQTSTNGIIWKPGYSVNTQLPGTFHDPNNIPPVINPLTGEITFTIYNPSGGYHSTAVKVSAYKCRQLVASIYRDIPVSLLACPPTPTIPPLNNTPPQVTFKWCPACPPIPLPAGDTVYAGDSVNFYVVSQDIQFLPGFQGQTNYLYPSGSQFGAGFADTLNGCLYPPCAILDTGSIYYNPPGNNWEGQFGISTSFSWKTDCNHLAQVNACFTKSNTYNFIFKVLDNWCPAPGQNFQTFAITVKAPPGLDPPKLKCSRVFSNGNVLLRWDQPVTKLEDTLNSYRKYIIYRADSANGQYDTIHIVTDIDSLQWLDVTANATVSPKYYFIQGISSCNDQYTPIWSDTISSLHLLVNTAAGGGKAALQWNDYNPGNRWGSQTTGRYYVWEINGTDTAIVDTVTESWDTLEVYHCYPTNLEYFVTVEDTTLGWGCTSNSTISGNTFGDNQSPASIPIVEMSYDINNQLQVNWTSASPDVGMFYIFKGALLIDSVPPPITTFSYTPAPNEPCRLQFSIQARDTCGNTNNIGSAQMSMCNVIRDVVRCDTAKKIVFSWNKYNPGWPNGSGMQEIWRSVNGGPYALLDSVMANDTMYSDTALIAPATYRYRIRSWETGKTRSAWSAWDSTSILKLIDGTIVGPPDVRCVSWQNDSTIRLEWYKPTNDSLNFNRYHIWQSSNGMSGPFSVIDSIGGITTSDNLAWDSTGYTVQNAFGSNYAFYVTSSSGCTGLEQSSTPVALRAIDLQVNSVSDSVNSLTWNKVYQAPATPNNIIWRDGNMINTTPYGSEIAEDVLVVCDKDVEYQVSYPDGTGRCESTSKLVDGDFEDNTPPAKQFLDSVSVTQDTTFTGLVGWSKNPSSDVMRYFVLNCSDGAYKTIDTILGTSPLFYSDFKNAPLGVSTGYSVVAEDSCGNNRLSQMDPNCHFTINLTTTMDFCDESILLEWNPYQDFVSGTGVETRIFASINGGPFEEIGRSNDARYRYENLINGNNYCFYVQSWEQGGSGPFSSSSGVMCIDAEFIRKPDYAYMRFATVADTGLIRMAMKIDLTGDIGEYWVKRSPQKNAGFRVIATVPVPDPLTPADSVFYFQDQDVNPNRNNYYYRVDVIDPCGGTGIISNVGRTILLKIRADNEKNVNVLTWNPYEEWEGGVKEYEVWRGTDPLSLTKVRSLPLSQFGNLDEVTVSNDAISFRDDVSAQATSGNGQFFYKVVAKEGSGTFRNIDPANSESNIASTIQYPLFYVPTAFTPNGDGLNDMFRPLGAFHDLKAYHIEIYNRWGERIYMSDDYQTGWDGTHNGKEVPGGVYVYTVNYTAADGKSYEKQGTVSLNR